MKPYQWIAAFVLGLIVHVTDVVLTIELIEFESSILMFYEGNDILAPFFMAGLYLPVFVIKCLGWFIFMCLAIHHKAKRWVTPTVIWSATAGFTLIVLWNWAWVLFIRNIPA